MIIGCEEVNENTERRIHPFAGGDPSAGAERGRFAIPLSRSCWDWFVTGTEGYPNVCSLLLWSVWVPEQQGITVAQNPPAYATFHPQHGPPFSSLPFICAWQVSGLPWPKSCIRDSSGLVQRPAVPGEFNRVLVKLHLGEWLPDMTLFKSMRLSCLSSGLTPTHPPRYYSAWWWGDTHKGCSIVH